MKKILTGLFVLFLFRTCLSQPVQQNWVNNSNNWQAQYRWITLDNSGNIYVVGSGASMDSPFWTTLEKISPSGSTVYDYEIIDTPGLPVGISFDSLFNEYIACYYQGSWGPSSFSLCKYNSSGTRIWRTCEPIAQNDYASDMAGDRSGNSFVLRYKGGVNQIVKYNSSGVSQTTFNISDTINPQKILLDYQNNIIILGSAGTASVVTIKYSSSFTRLWRSTYVFSAGGPLFGSYKIKSGNNGNIFLLFQSNNPVSYSDYSVIKYNTSGIQQWVSFYDYNHQNDEPSSFKLDNSENVYITGSTGTVKFNSSGNLVWHDTTKYMRDITTDRFNNVYLTGSNTYSTTGSDMLTVKLNSNGVRVWSISYNGSYGAGDAAYALVLDTALNVYVTGISDYIPILQYDHSHGTTLKYSQPIGIKKISESVPDKFSLSQNYPNPFNPATVINYRLPITNFVKLVIYDAPGREVAVLVNEKQQAGEYQVEWNASNYASGIYFYKLSTAEFTETKKMVLVK